MSEYKNAPGGGEVPNNPPTEIVGGVVPAGTINYGEGFSVLRTGVGLYQVTFTVPFATAPAIQLGSDSGVFRRLYWTAGPSLDNRIDFVVHTEDPAGVAVDSFFNFVAHGS